MHAPPALFSHESYLPGPIWPQPAAAGLKLASPPFRPRPQLFPGHAKIGRLTRAIKRADVSLYNCLASIHHDAAFVAEIAALYEPLPVVANLRCGLWYAPAPAATAYFKSTDGHCGNWGFSTTRLNMVMGEEKGRERRGRGGGERERPCTCFALSLCVLIHPSDTPAWSVLALPPARRGAGCCARRCGAGGRHAQRHQALSGQVSGRRGANGRVLWGHV